MDKENSVTPKKVGDKITYTWRPEDVELYKEGMENKLEGLISQAIFMGNMTDLFLDVNGFKIRAQMAGRIYLKEGEKITLSISSLSFRLIEVNDK